MLLGAGSRLCEICGLRRAVVGWCDPCRKSYDKHIETDDGTILAAILWGAKRARYFEKRRAKKAGKR